jgi:SAM-dependent methyltransferase
MMRYLSYIRYFCYIAYHWNPRIAWHIVREEIRGERQYGLNTTGADELGHLRRAGIDISHATIYMPVAYNLLEQLFETLDLSRTVHFVDIGCGKGRALAVAAHYGVRKLTGIELSKPFCRQTEEQLAKTAIKFPGLQYRVIHQDAFYAPIPDDADLIFLFNPFDEVIMSSVANSIDRSRQEHPRDITLIYVNPIHRGYFKEKGAIEQYHTRTLQYLEAVVLLLPASTQKSLS